MDDRARDDEQGLFDNEVDGDVVFPDETDDPFTRADLVAAVAAAQGFPAHLRAWGEEVVGALRTLPNPRAAGAVLDPAFDVLTSAVRGLHQSLTPFDGMLEAPSRIVDLYQAHRDAVAELRDTRDRVVGALVADVADLVMSDLGGLTWAELVRAGATRERPPAPVSDWDL